ncbi:hypothetical protein BSF38_04761 [Paludisphaera borealis]|uniref:Uncharacterized protein n=1 Tax=Paludisphaera borealis TaxID=1387353 RepID=A0A1U7CW73_9BACT|nr:hypothetical protein BSF38_04761 [Paludisphaera borealis]
MGCIVRSPRNDSSPSHLGRGGPRNVGGDRRPIGPSVRLGADSASRGCVAWSLRRRGRWRLIKKPAPFGRGRRLMGVDWILLELPDSLACERPVCLTALDSMRRRGVPANPAPGALRAGYARRMRAGGQAVSSRRDFGGRHVAGPVRTGDLLIRDRGLFGDALIAEVLRRGAHFLARAKCNSVQKPIRSLTEGAFLSKDPSESGRPVARLQRVVAPWHRVQLRRPTQLF